MDGLEGDRDRFEDDDLADLAALLSPDQPEDLWRVLVMQPGRSTTHHSAAVGLFVRLHEEGTPGALTTAQLLCTDGRWDRSSGRLIAGIHDTGILSEDALDALAGSFLWVDRFHFEVPRSWVGLEWMDIDLGGEGRSPSGPVLRLHPSAPVTVERRIPPPLRRWAAAHVLGADPGAFDRMAGRAQDLATIDGGAVVSGMLDVAGALGDHLVNRAIGLGLGWAMGSVRLHAIGLLAERDLQAAVERAAADPDAKVRAWSSRPPQKRVGSSPRQATERPRVEDGVPGAPEAQQTLFDD